MWPTVVYSAVNFWAYAFVCVETRHCCNDANDIFEIEQKHSVSMMVLSLLEQNGQWLDSWAPRYTHTTVDTIINSYKVRRVLSSRLLVKKMLKLIIICSSSLCSDIFVHSGGGAAHAYVHMPIKWNNINRVAIHFLKWVQDVPIKKQAEATTTKQDRSSIHSKKKKRHANHVYMNKFSI